MSVQFQDGQSPATQTPTPTFDPDGVRLAFAGGSVVFWPAASLAVAVATPDTLLLRQEPDTGARLTLSGLEAAAARAAYPRLFSAKRALARTAGLVLGLALLAGSFAGLALVAWPLAAGPIARALPDGVEQRLGAVASAQVAELGGSCAAETAQAGLTILDGLVQRLDLDRPTDAPPIRVAVVDLSFPNAFALPDHQVVLTAELIALSDNPDQVAGVLAHEIAHVRAGHVTEGFVRQAGAGMLVDILLGGGGFGQLMVGTSAGLGLISHTRADEVEADAIALNMLNRAQINPAGLGAFFRKIHEEEAEIGIAGIPAWITSHPDTLERAAAAEAMARPDFHPALSPEDWTTVQALCQGDKIPVRLPISPPSPDQQ